MAARSYVVNELLYFFINNSNMLENDCFLNNTAGFYNNDDIVSALKQLKNDLDNLKCEKYEKLVSRGNLKEKFLEIISILKFLNANDMLEKCPIFVSMNIAKIPKLDNFLKINFEKIRKDISDVLNKQQMQIIESLQPLLSQREENFAAKNKVNTKAPNNINNENVTQKAKSHNVNDKVVKTENWADDLDTPTDKSMQPFTLVEKRKRLNKFPGILYETQDSDSVQPLKYSEVAKKTKSKIIGNKVNNECKLKAEKIIVKKVFS
ncbi:hypothetical protein HELRODRAFT_164226 [Helobdella robusta]|uniref:Uncharacterized protein n=1 Tax=Helobdella robusta TaxID=6412 RepID=T1EV46_HELRO|nr:hypothetical protein HELRODRAFT_164226 [Helobdella robusta]ESN94394.1 hypothetical protein HELRODRAFT_164226 [Helobdella robusta]